MRKMLFSFCVLVFLFSCKGPSQLAAASEDTKQGYIELRVYHYDSRVQEYALDSFLQTKLLPALHAQQIPSVGVFKPIANDTAADKKVIVLIPHSSLSRFASEPRSIHPESGKVMSEGTKPLPPYNRLETILLSSFGGFVNKPGLQSAPATRVYELRSYESATEALHLNKVDMFTKGGETKIFERLNFHPVFYGSVIAGSRMPNLMYMTSFESIEARNEGWKAFGQDPDWKRISPLPEYANNVSHIDITLMRGVPYSDL